MPIYTFKCTECNFKQEELIDKAKKDEPAECKACGKESKRLGLDSFSATHSVPGSPMTSREIDMVVGADAAMKWKQIENDKVERRARLYAAGARDMGPVAQAGKFNPHALLGGAKRKELGQAWTSAAQRQIQSGVDFDGKPFSTR